MSVDKSDFTVIFIAIILLILSIVLRYFINRKRFNRRGSGGLQQFENYRKATITTLLEKILMKLSIVIIFISIISIIFVVIF